MVNADSDELKKFGSFGDRWWNPVGEFELLQKVNPVRVGYINTQAKLAGKRVLDVGCGGGLLSEAMAQLGAQVTGLDLAAPLIDAARAHAAQTRTQLEYLQVPVEQLAAERPAQFEVVTCLEMLEHVPDPGSIVEAIGRLVKPGGLVFISTLNRSLRSWLFSIFGLEYVLRLVPVGTHDWAKYLKPSELEAFCQASGLTVVDRRGILFNPLTERFWLGQDLEVNYLFQLRRAIP